MTRRYPPGQDPDFWIPNPPKLDYRYALGRVGANMSSARPLIVIGMNPSHASDLNSDATINNLIEASVQLGYAGWLMLNLYPERASSPRNLSGFDPSVADSNCDVITEVLARTKTTEVWGGWGNLPNSTIRQAKTAVLQAVSAIGVRVFHFGDLTKKGEPRHLNPRFHKLDVSGQRRYLN